MSLVIICNLFDTDYHYAVGRKIADIENISTKVGTTLGVNPN